MKKIILFSVLSCLLLTSCHAEEIVYRDKWGIELIAENVTDKGMTLKCVQSDGAHTGELQTGEWYTIDKNVNGEWEPLDTEPLDFAWNMVAYMIKENDVTEFDIDWEWLYGRLPAGEYRLNKEIMGFRKAGDYDTKVYSAEFTVEERKAFLATVLDETTTYMIVEPDLGESEREAFEKIKIDYENDHYDFLYGIGRRVVIYYSGEIDKTGVIKTDDISTEGFRDFELSVVPSESKIKNQIIRKAEPHEKPPMSGWYYGDINLYYYGLENVYIEVDGENIPFDVALKQGKITTNAIIANANNDVRKGILEEIVYKDGGSQIYKYPEYTIIKYHTLDGNRDVYIGSPDMDITIKDK